MRYAIRSVIRNPAYSLTVLLTLTLVIGANSAIFTLANSLILASLPVDHPERLVEISTINPKGGKGNLSIPVFQAIQEQSSSPFSSELAWSGGGMENLEMHGVPFAGSVDDVAGDYLGLARAEARAIEFSIRAALGANPRRLSRHFRYECCMGGTSTLTTIRPARVLSS